MITLWRKPEFFDPQLGKFIWVGGGMWSSDPDSKFHLAVEGDKSRPDEAALVVARNLVKEGCPFLEAAEAFVLHDPNAIDFLRDGGKLIDGGFTVLKSGEFEVDFSVSDWPDAMITVKFQNEKPCAVLLAD